MRERITFTGALLDDKQACYQTSLTPQGKEKQPSLRMTVQVVDSKGIEPSNLTDANRALSHP